MKGSSHILSGVPATFLGHWLFIWGAVAPDLAWFIAIALNGFKKPEFLTDWQMVIYRIGHSLFTWAALALLAAHWGNPLGWGFVAGGALHLLMDWPSHSGNRPLYPFTWAFDGWGL